MAVAATVFNGPVRAKNQPRPVIVQSGRNDLIEILRGKAPGRIIDKIMPANPDQSGRVLPPNRDLAARQVLVCLQNGASGSGRKAFDFRQTQRPQFVASPGTRVCALLEPTLHTIYLWKAEGKGKLLATLSLPLDLNEADGTLVVLDWKKDR